MNERFSRIFEHDSLTIQSEVRLAACQESFWSKGVVLIVIDVVPIAPESVIQNSHSANLDLPFFLGFVVVPVVVEHLVYAFSVDCAMSYFQRLTDAESFKIFTISSEEEDRSERWIRVADVENRDLAEKVSLTTSRVQHVVVRLRDDENVFLEGDVLDIRLVHHEIVMKNVILGDEEHLNGVLPDVSGLV